uniref:Uncharacterized protein n=1 Tax=Cacopsylla melanoneura TaxID=428564 RepID=A0A8D8XXI8_9HEMI
MAPKRKKPIQSSCKSDQPQSTSKVIKTEVSPGLFTTRYSTRSATGLESTVCVIEHDPLDIPADTFKAECSDQELSDSEQEIDLKVEDSSHVKQPPVNYNPVVLLDELNSVMINEHVDDSAVECEENGDIPNNNDPQQETPQKLPKFQFDSGKVSDLIVKKDQISDCEDNIGNRAEKEQPKERIGNKKDESEKNKIALETNTRAEKENAKRSMGNEKGCQTYELECTENICLFCKKLSKNMKTHLKTAHTNEKEMKKALACASPSKRRDRLDHVIKLGNFFHNMEALRTGKGLLMIIRMEDENVVGPLNYEPCPYCLTFTRKKNLILHKPICPDYNPSLTDSQLPLTKARILFESRNAVDFVWMKQDTGIPDRTSTSTNSSKTAPKIVENPFPYPASTPKTTEKVPLVNTSTSTNSSKVGWKKNTSLSIKECYS